MISKMRKPLLTKREFDICTAIGADFVSCNKDCSDGEYAVLWRGFPDKYFGAVWPDKYFGAVWRGIRTGCKILAVTPLSMFPSLHPGDGINVIGELEYRKLYMRENAQKVRVIRVHTGKEGQK